MLVDSLPHTKKVKLTTKFVGCNVVSTNPASDGSRAFIGPMFPLQVGDTVYFKQVNDDLTVSPVATGSYCE